MSRAASPARRAGAIGRAAMVHLTLGGYCLLVLCPIALVLLNSFKTRAGIFEDPLGLPTKATLSVAGYGKVLGDADFIEALSFSMTLALGATAGAVLLGLPAAFAVARQMPGSALVKFSVACLPEG